MGSLICTRGGAAVDFMIDDEDMREVAQWIVKNCPFDRLYFYGADRPIHVSYSASEAGQIVDLNRKSFSGGRIPKTISVEKFLA